MADAYDAAQAYLDLAATALLGAQRCLRAGHGERYEALEAARAVIERAARNERERIIWERAFLESLDRARVRAQQDGKRVAA